MFIHVSYGNFQAKEKFLEIARRVGETQRECGMNIPVDDYLAQFRFGLLEVAFEWARGMVCDC